MAVMCDASSYWGVKSLVIYFIGSVGVKFRVNLYKLPVAASQAKLKQEYWAGTHHGIRWNFDKRDTGASCHTGEHRPYLSN